MHTIRRAILSATALIATPALAAPTPLIAIYKDIHRHAELSHQEVKTSAIVAAELKAAGFEVHDHLGVYPDGVRAYGVLGVMKNGKGPTLLIRADMDALPIVEETGAPYASKVTTTDMNGKQVGVMHACGHDIHTTVLIGVARALTADKAHWHGTILLLGQPSEETVDGARAIVADHVYERFGRPDMIVGLHDGVDYPAGVVALAIGPAQAGVTSVDVTIRGIGGHGAMPQMGRDPVVMAAQFVTQLQSIVSREEDPQDPSVVTVGSIHGGTRRNIISDSVKLELTTRALTDKGMDTIIEGIRARAKGLAVANQLDADHAPIVTVIDRESAPPLYNDPALSARVRAALIASVGEENYVDAKPIMPSEDVGNLGLPGHKIPLAYYSLGAANPDAFRAAKAKGQSLPNPHSSKFLPDPEPTIATGVKTMTAVAKALLP